MYRLRVYAASAFFPRLVFSFALAGSLLLTGLILLTYRQTSGNANLGTLLRPSTDCVLPCFLDITPGVTTIKDGLELLRANHRVRSISPTLSSSFSSPAPSGLYNIEFDQPSILRARMLLVTKAYQDTVDGILLMDTGIQLSDIVLMLGQPTQVVLEDRLHLGRAVYVGFYSQYQVYVQIILPICSLEASAFWSAQHDILIGIESERRYAQQLGFYSEEVQQRDGAWQQHLHAMKQIDCA
jgi:hypothetical protein